MLVKKFQAANMAEALKQVKAEFGLDAMILNSRQERGKGIWRFFRKPYVEVTAAMASPTSGAARSSAEGAEETKPNTRDEFRNAMLEPLVREIRELKAKVDVLYEKEDGSAGSGREEEQGSDRSLKQEEFAKVRWATGDIRVDFPAKGAEEPTLSKESSDPPVKQTALAKFAEELQENGVDTENAGKLMGMIGHFIGRKRKRADLGKGLGQALESLIDFSGASAAEGAQRIIALVGPTGVGKTTTAAKLAVTSAKQGKRVAIISADSLKPGDVDHFKRLTSGAEIEIESATTPQKLARSLKKHRERDIVLIDTGGVSPLDGDGMAHLQKLLAACPGVEKHLCLSSTTRDRELTEAVKRFAAHSVDRLLFTRLDESETFGSIINVLLKSKLAPSYLTTGQKMAGDIEFATAGRLSALAIGGN